VNKEKAFEYIKLIVAIIIAFIVMLFVHLWKSICTAAKLFIENQKELYKGMLLQWKNLRSIYK